MAHHSIRQSRAPKGHPDGGEWTGQAGEAGAFDLRELGDASYNADGSFEFPPAPRTAVQVISFWSHVPVPDPILEGAKYVWQRWRANELDEAMLAWSQRASDESTEEGADFIHGGVPIDQWLHARVVAHCAEFPVEIADDDIRTVLRAAQAYWQAQELPAHERDIVLNHTLYLNDRSGMELSIGDCEHRYGFNRSDRDLRAKGVFRDRSRWVGEDLAQLREDLADAAAAPL